METPLPGDWAPELLDGILSSANPEASDALYRAVFAAGPAIIPQLEAALKDDRTAEFAAQSLAFVGGSQALQILSKLLHDPRDLDLRRFYYGALGEFETREATQALLDAMTRSDTEPDRTVTEAAILALTVRADENLVPILQQAKVKIQDVVIRDDLDNALDVIEGRSRYLASRQGKQPGGSIEEAVRTYFIPALEPLPPPAPPKRPLASSPSTPETGTVAAKSGVSSKQADSRRDRSESKPPEPGVKVSIQALTFAPDKMRALARVVFEDPSALANYDIVLQKQYGNWTIASVWLGSETEKTLPQPKTKPPEE